jgi:hypothetical protein
VSCRVPRSWTARCRRRDGIEGVGEVDATDAAHRAEPGVASCESLVELLPFGDVRDGRLRRRRLSQSHTRLAEKSGPLSIREKPVVTDADETARQYMSEETPHEITGGQRQEGGAISASQGRWLRQERRYYNSTAKRFSSTS